MLESKACPVFVAMKTPFLTPVVRHGALEVSFMSYFGDVYGLRALSYISPEDTIMVFQIHQVYGTFAKAQRLPRYTAPASDP